jgi:hypothetical protein
MKIIYKIVILVSNQRSIYSWLYLLFLLYVIAFIGLYLTLLLYQCSLPVGKLQFLVQT